MHTGDAQVKIIHWTVSDRIANCNPSLSRSTQAAFMSCWNFKMWLSTANRWHAAWLSFDAGLFWSETLIKRFTHRREVKVYFAETTPDLMFQCSAFEHPADVRFFCEPFVLERTLFGHFDWSFSSNKMIHAFEYGVQEATGKVSRDSQPSTGSDSAAMPHVCHACECAFHSDARSFWFVSFHVTSRSFWRVLENIKTDKDLP